MKLKSLLLPVLLLASLVGLAAWFVQDGEESQDVDICIISGAPVQGGVYNERIWRGFAMRFDLDGLLKRYPSLSYLDRYKDLNETESASGAMAYDLAKMSFREWGHEFFLRQLGSPYPVGYVLFSTPLRNTSSYNRIFHEKTGRTGLPFGPYAFEGGVLCRAPVEPGMRLDFARRNLYMDVQKGGWELALCCHSLNMEKLADRLENVDWTALPGKVAGLRSGRKCFLGQSSPRRRNGLAHGVYLLQVDGTEFLVLAVTPHCAEPPAPSAEYEAACDAIFLRNDSEL